MSQILRYSPTWTTILLIFAATVVHAQCPTCTPISPPIAGLADDDLYISDVMDGTQGDYYDDLLTFRMPQTTQPICDQFPGFIPEVFCGLDISQVEIVDVVGLPQGITYTTSQADAIYELPDEKDGCATVCGTPLFPGDYVVTIIVKATVLGISQTTSFEQDMFIAPKVSSTVGFTANPAAGCEDLTVEFANNLPSNGNSGVTYSWDFGNGLNSTSENPPTQTYTEPGSYTVTYQAVIDTVPRQLALVNIVESDCNDNFAGIPGAPDFFIKILDPNGDEIYSTEDTPIQNQSPPLEIMIDTTLNLTSGNYVLEVWDSDPAVLNQDDFCGTINFTQSTTGSLVDGELTVELTINNFTETITATDTIEVYALPNVPVISGETSFCPGDSIALMSSATTGNQWYFDGNAVVGATDAVYQAKEVGDYYVTTTTPSNCSATSTTITLVLDIPDDPAISIPGGDTELCPGETITLISTAADSYQWYLDAAPIANTNTQNYEADEVGSYTVTVTSDTGCSLTSAPVALQECTTSVDNIEAIGNTLTTYPNPNDGQFILHFEVVKNDDFNIIITDLTGRNIYTEILQNFSGIYHKNIELTNTPSGLYFIKINSLTRKLVIR